MVQFWKNYHNSGQCAKGYLLNWQDNQKVHYLSSYEAVYIHKILNGNKLFYRQNYKIHIPYIHPEDNEVHQYIPDFIIYEDEERTKIKYIIEVKPYIFLYNPKNNKSSYYEITRVKKEALIRFCENQEFSYKFITELDLCEDEKYKGIERRGVEEFYNENIKNNKSGKNIYRRTPEGLLLRCQT
jgi:hypothetical protein